jgi:hypothetical protein
MFVYLCFSVVSLLAWLKARYRDARAGVQQGGRAAHHLIMMREVGAREAEADAVATGTALPPTTAMVPTLPLTATTTAPSLPAASLPLPK